MTALRVFGKEYGVRSLTMYRIKAGLNQTQLAERAGVRQATIARYENGTRNPSPEALGRLADALGVQEWDLTYAEQLMERRHAVERVVEEFATAAV